MVINESDEYYKITNKDLHTLQYINIITRLCNINNIMYNKLLHKYLITYINNTRKHNRSINTCTTKTGTIATPVIYKKYSSTVNWTFMATSYHKKKNDKEAFFGKEHRLAFYLFLHYHV